MHRNELRKTEMKTEMNERKTEIKEPFFRSSPGEPRGAMVGSPGRGGLERDGGPRIFLYLLSVRNDSFYVNDVSLNRNDFSQNVTKYRNTGNLKNSTDSLLKKTTYNNINT